MDNSEGFTATSSEDKTVQLYADTNVRGKVLSVRSRTL